MQYSLLRNPQQNSCTYNWRIFAKISQSQLQHSPFQYNIDLLLQHRQEKRVVQRDSPTDGNSIYTGKLRQVDETNGKFIGEDFPECVVRNFDDRTPITQFNLPTSRKCLKAPLLRSTSRLINLQQGAAIRISEALFLVATRNAV